MKMDVYSFGIILWEVWTGKSPTEALIDMCNEELKRDIGIAIERGDGTAEDLKEKKRMVLRNEDTSACRYIHRKGLRPSIMEIKKFPTTPMGRFDSDYALVVQKIIDLTESCCKRSFQRLTTKGGRRQKKDRTSERS